MNPLVFLAKSAVENFVKEGKIISSPENLPQEFLNRRAGTFVTIEKMLRGLPRSPRPQIGGGVLRGCIGTYLPTKENIAKEIISNAIATATEDYRFGPIQEKELSSLSYTVYILSEPELIKDISKLNPKKYGVIVKTAQITSSGSSDVVFNGHLPYKSGLLLPDLEGIDTIEKQIVIACQKGGIDPTKERIIVYKFTVEKYAQ